MDFLPLVVLGFAGYVGFLVLFLRFVGMLRRKDGVALKG